MKMFHFIVVLKGHTDFTEEMADRIYEAGCDDGALAMSNDMVYVEFDREAEDAATAVASAYVQLHSAGFSDLGIALDLATVPEIARRTGRSRQDIHQLIARKSEFPKPLSPWQVPHSAANKPLWNWAEVEDFFIVHEGGNLDYERGDMMGVFSAMQFLQNVPQKERQKTIKQLAECV